MVKKLENLLLICDGPDGAGKSQLAFHLIEKYRFNYLHHGVVDDIKTYHGDSLDIAYEHMRDYHSNWLLDRLHISEEVYGTIFRNGPSYDWKKLNENILQEFSEVGKYVLVMCIPPKENCMKKHAERLANGDEMFNTIEQVYDSYEKLYNENKNNIQIYKYDYTEDPNYEKLDEFLETI